MLSTIGKLCRQLHAGGRAWEYATRGLPAALAASPSTRRPIFVMSESGSGSTWIATMLGETSGYVFIHELKVVRGRGVARALKFLGRHPTPSSAQLLYWLQEGLHLARLWSLDQHAEWLGRPELGGRSAAGEPGVNVVNSTGSNIAIVPLLRRAYPEAVLCFVVRDPRDTVASVFYRKPFGPQSSLEGWSQSYVRHYELFKAYAAPYDVDLLRYEEWLDDPAGRLEQFVLRHRLPTDPERLRATAAQYDARILRHRSQRLGNLTAKPAAWRTDLRPEEIERLRPILTPVLVELGYEASADWR